MLRRNSSRAIASSIRRRVSGATGLELLTTNDTVAIETPAASATSRMVVAIAPHLPHQVVRADRTGLGDVPR